LVQVAHAHVEHCTTEDVDVRVAGAVDRAEDRRHHRGRHPRRPQALVRVAQRDVDKIEAFRPGRLLHPSSGSGSMTTSTSPGSTRAPFGTRISVTTPRASAGIEFISFITSMMQTVLSASTCFPTSTNGSAPVAGARWTVPTIGDRTGTPPAGNTGSPAGQPGAIPPPGDPAGPATTAHRPR